MIVKIVNIALILFAVFMGLKQGYAMATGRLEMLQLFEKWGMGTNAVMINGLITLLASLLILHPKTFVWGNFLMAAGILLIICFHLQDKNVKGVLNELPFLLINLVILYLRHPLQTR